MAEQIMTLDRPPHLPGWYWAQAKMGNKWQVVEITREGQVYAAGFTYPRQISDYKVWSYRCPHPQMVADLVAKEK